MRVTAISSFLPTLSYSHLRPDAGAQLNRGYMNQTVTWECHKELSKLYIKTDMLEYTSSLLDVTIKVTKLARIYTYMYIIHTLPYNLILRA